MKKICCVMALMALVTMAGCGKDQNEFVAAPDVALASNSEESNKKTSEEMEQVQQKGDGKVHTFKGKYSGTVNEEGLYIFSYKGDDEDISYTDCVAVNLQDNEEYTDLVKKDMDMVFEITYVFEESMVSPVSAVKAVSIEE